MKKLILIVCSVMIAVGAMAQNFGPQKEASAPQNIATSDIVYWVGTGSNEAMFTMIWGTADNMTGFTWGYRWNDSDLNGDVMISTMMSAIDAADDRVTMTGVENGFLTNITYNDGTLNLSVTGGFMNIVNGTAPSGGISNIYLQDGDDVRFCDGTITGWGGQFPTSFEPTPATDPNGGVTPSTGFGPDDVLYWVGTGSNEAVFSMIFCDENGENLTALGWGYRWDGTAVVADMMRDIDSADDRLSFVGVDDGYVSDATYNDGTLNLSGTGMGFIYTVNDNSASGIGGEPLNDGANVEFCDFTAAPTMTIPDVTVTPVSAPTVTPDIPATGFGPDDVLYWVGTGSNEAVFSMIFCDENGGNLTAVGWGYRWDGTAVVADMMRAIDAADDRLSFVGVDAGYVSDATYNDGTLNLAGTGMSFIYTVNDVSASNGISNQPLTDGDNVEFCDYMAAPSFTIPDVTVIPVTDPNGGVETPEDATIASSDIVYWVGEGTNEAILVVNWANPDSALAWGYKFSEDTVIVEDMMTEIAANDDRFSFTAANGMLSEINFVANDTITWGITEGQYWMYNVNGVAAPNMFNAQKIVNGDVVKWGDPAAASAVVTDSSEWGGVYYLDQIVWTKAVTPVTEPEIKDATIAATDILYWVGEGENKVIFSVNWADTVLAWGYKFTEESVTLKQVMDDIDSADYRFTYESTSMVDDIIFYAVKSTGDGYDTIKLADSEGNYWWSNVNGAACQHMYTEERLHNGDFVKWGDPTAEGAVVLASSEYAGVSYPSEIVWTTAVTAVSVIGPFSAGIGTDGCEAISCENSEIVAWANACTIERGPQQIGANENPALYGEEADATGAVTMDDNLSVVSLGDGGMATLTFENSLKNEEGPDFAVFENSFNDAFLELAFVEVSSDGVNFVRFPATSLTQTETQIAGTGVVDPTMINNLAGKYRAGWGTSFDLEVLRDSANIDINHVTHVRIVDVIGSVDPELGSKDAFGNMVNDPFPTPFASCGFDLDGVAAIHMNTSEGIDDVVKAEMSVYPNPTSGRLVCNLNSDETANVVVYDMTGRIVKQVVVNGSAVLDMSDLANGIYMMRAGKQTTKIVVRK